MSDLLELHEAEGIFERLESWLRGHGFFEPGGETRAADVYLGYGISSSLRRTRTPQPPEPCAALPLAAARITTTRLVTDCHKQLEVGRWQPTWAPDEYRAAIDEVREAIARGDVYQVNLVQHLSAPFAGEIDGLVQALRPLRPLHPEPFVGEGWAVVSASPELFLQRRGDRIRTMPIKGTRPVGGEVELAASEKDQAEHVMIVDLERNDLSRVCLPGSVRWPELMATRELAGVAHMVSTVEGTLRPGVGLAEILAATFPGGSVTGAPKIAAVDLIARLEPVGRGASMGAIGRVFGNGDFELVLTIRTLAVADGRVHLWVGGGIVWDSDPDAEVEESWTKAAPLLEALGAPRSLEVVG